MLVEAVKDAVGKGKKWCRRKGLGAEITEVVLRIYVKGENNAGCHGLTNHVE